MDGKALLLLFAALAGGGYYLTQNPLSLLFFADDPIPEPQFDFLLPTWTPSPYFFIDDYAGLLPLSMDSLNGMINNDEDDADDDDSWFDGPPIPLSFFSQPPNAPPGCGVLNLDSFRDDADDGNLPTTPPSCTLPTIAEDAHAYDETYTCNDGKDFDEKMEYVFNVLSTLKANLSSLSSEQQQHLQFWVLARTQ